MNSFASYMGCVMTVSLCAFLCENISAVFKNSPTLKKGLSLITSICIFMTVTAPVFSAVKNLNFSFPSPVTELQESTNQNLFSLTIEKVENTLTLIILEENGLQTESINVTMKSEETNPQIDEINVKLHQKDENMKDSVMGTIQKYVEGDTKINVGISEEDN